MLDRFVFYAIGVVRASRAEMRGDGWNSDHASIELVAPYDERALRGLDEFSHCAVLFVLDRATWTEDRMLRRPRDNPAWPEVGIFAQRTKDRPNPIGLSVCAILAVEGARVDLDGLDAIDGTPVLDLTPWVREFSPSGRVVQPHWITELMARYW